MSSRSQQRISLRTVQRDNLFGMPKCGNRQREREERQQYLLSTAPTRSQFVGNLFYLLIIKHRKDIIQIEKNGKYSNTSNHYHIKRRLYAKLARGHGILLTRICSEDHLFFFVQIFRGFGF